MICFKAALFLCLLLGTSDFIYSQNVKINEIMSSNHSTIMDEDGDYSDWIELYNTGPTPVNLHGYGLSDDEAQPFKWIMPKVTLLPDSFLVVWASGKDRADSINPHTSFGISASGEEIIFTLPNNVIAHKLSVPLVPEDVSFGKIAGADTTFRFFQKPTPGAINDSMSFEGILSEPVFSREGGVYATPFDLEITASDPAATIIYTLDGSEPDPENLTGTTYQYKNSYPFGPLLTSSFSSRIYNSPIKIYQRNGEPDSLTRKSSTYHVTPAYFPDTPVYKGSVVKAKIVKSGYLSPKAVTNTYFIGNPDRFSLPVANVTTNAAHFFDYESGIYTAGVDFDNWKILDTSSSNNGHSPANYKKETEFPGHIEIFENFDKRVLSQDIGFRIHGGYSRANPVKSLRIYARNEYGESKLNYKFFPEEPYDAYKRIILRASGNDYNRTLIRDAAIQSISSHLSFETQAFHPAILFINGEYWGIHNFTERYDKHYFERKYNADPDNIDIIFGNRQIEEGDAVHFIETLTYLEINGVADSINYQHICTRIDVDNFIDYQLSEIFCGNIDWPHNNVKSWRSKNEFNPSAAPQLDGRWRWMMYDTDQGFGFSNRSPETNNLELVSDPTLFTLMIRKLLENESFRNDFINRFTDQLNSAFLPEVMVAKINLIRQKIAPEVPEHIARWKTPGSVNSWGNYIEQMLTYVKERPFHQREHLRSFFKLGNDYLLTVNVSDTTQGYVKVNKLELHSGTVGIPSKVYPWSGSYFQGVPIKLEAIPAPGFKFVKWQGVKDSLSPSITIAPSGPTSVVAVFEKKPASTVLHYWNFNDSTDISKVAFTVSEANLQTNFSPSPENLFTSGNGAGFIGENAQFGDSAGLHLRVNNPVGSALELSLPTPGFSHINLLFEARRSDKGASEMIIEYSLDGINFIEKESVVARNDIPTLNLIDFSNITGSANNFNFKVRIRFLQGQGGLAGNNRIDNVSLTGIRDTLLSTNNLGISDKIIIQSYPNPFHQETNIKVNLPAPSKMKLTLYDIYGYIWEEIAENDFQAGTFDFKLNTGKLTSGVYFIICRTGNIQSQHKIIKY